MGITVQFLLAGGAAFVAAAALIPLLARVAAGYGVIAAPSPDRLHDTPTPYLGGLAIVITACAVAPFLNDWKPEATIVLLAAAGVGAVGLIDDVRTVRPWKRLVVEALAATIAAAAGARVDLLNGPLDWVITVAWLVGVTNAYNLVDNMDGAAGVIASTTALALALAAGLEGQVLVGGLAAVLSGASIGFLVYNWHPARIFMGDAGSLFLGFLLGVIALELRFPVAHHTASVGAVVLLTGPALFDTTLVVISRARAGQPVYLGGVDHTSHRLLRLGLHPVVVVTLLGLASAACCGLGVAVGRGSLPVAPVFGATVVLGLGLLVALLRVEVPTTDGAPSPANLAPSAAAGA
ncbi:MAG TPA: MraY family glycosyltransferase [Acidimicrobiales bacterium]|nr:MraY family glycosyltransferase [Acidimicrobiales bacterium]